MQHILYTRWEFNDNGIRSLNRKKFDNRLSDENTILRWQFGILDFAQVMKMENVDYSDTVKFFEELASYIGSNRDSISEKAGHLNNQLDDIEGLVYKTLYKLKNLK